MPAVPSFTALATRIRDACRPHPVVLAYLFGSQARGAADRDSDIDIAVLADPALPPGERRSLRFRLMRECAGALRQPIGVIDLVILQDVPVLLQYNVIRHGKMLFEKDPSVRRAYELEVGRRYEDERPSLDRETEITLERILSRAP